MELEQKILDYCQTHGLTLGLAESCTGGAIASSLTKTPGASNYFLGSIVAYAIPVKQKLLNVQQSTIERHTVTSEAVAQEMAWGAIQALGANIALGVTGIAGPLGGTKNIPVGSIYMSICNDLADYHSQSFLLSGNRAEIIEQAVNIALKMIFDYLNK